MAHRIVDGDEYPDRLYDAPSSTVATKARYRELRYLDDLGPILKGFEDRRGDIYATGLERGSSSIGYVAISTLFMREHNRIARELAKRHPNWHDQRIFQTARMINIIVLLKLLIEDYINHILGTELFLLEPAFADRRSWHRPNWIALEFNLLYRWHSLVPETLTIQGRTYSHREFRHNNPLFEKLGLAAVLTETSMARAGRICLGNTADFLMNAEYQSLRMARLFRLAPYNDYCRHFGIPPVSSFEELTGDDRLARQLHKIYTGDVGKLELTVGLFAEKAEDNVLFGRLMARMVAYDALTQIYSNPLLSRAIYNENTLTPFGIETVEQTTSLQVLADRNMNGRSCVASLAKVSPKL